uniref:Transcriptional adapter ADA2 isoform X1 n=1 Tax=Hirondellea gigas TaxID=1518452 RepID=A0A6A7G625_9CRUS
MGRAKGKNRSEVIPSVTIVSSSPSSSEDDDGETSSTTTKTSDTSIQSSKPEAKLPETALAARAANSASKAARRSGAQKSKGAHYHCDYCREDITSEVRIKCADCKDFDLCVNCFSMGVSVPPHENSHRYRVMEHVTGSIFDKDWGADEELLLLEGIEMFGLGNWADVADHVGTKTKMRCENHFTKDYLESRTAPLPIAVLDEPKSSKGKGKGTPSTEKEEKSTVKPGKEEVMMDTSNDDDDDKNSESRKNSVSSASSLNLSRYPSLNLSRPDRPRQLPRSAIHPSLMDQASLLSFLPERGDFDTEYDNDAEKTIADMDFKETDTEYERKLKLKVLHIFNLKLDERQRRKDFVIERGLLNALSRDKKKLNQKQKEIYRNMQVFARFHSPVEHETLLRGLYNEYRIRKRISQLQNFRLNGIRTFDESKAYEQERKRRMSSQQLRRHRESNPYLFPQTRETHLKRRMPPEKDKDGKAKIELQPPMDVTKFPGFDQLSDAEKKLCAHLHLEPQHYYIIKDAVAKEAYVKGMLKKGSNKELITIDINKTKDIFDFVISTGWTKKVTSEVSHGNKSSEIEAGSNSSGNAGSAEIVDNPSIASSPSSVEASSAMDTSS